jgi:hypothetical protein
MTPANLGFVSALLITYREIATHPVGRVSHPEEARAARILSDCGPTSIRQLDEFLASQGFTLCVLDGLSDLGLPLQGGARAIFYVLGRRVGEELAPFIEKGAFLSEFRDRRREKSTPESLSANKAHAVFWCARLWLTLQYFFYDRIDRPVGNLYMWRDAVVREEVFAAHVKEELELMGNQGRPDGEAGLLWDTYWEHRERVVQLTRKFFKLMAKYRMIQASEEEGIWRQTLAAAVDMAGIADASLQYLMPSVSDVTQRSLVLIKGQENVFTV